MRYRPAALASLILLLAGCGHDAYKEAAASLESEQASAKSEGVPMDITEVWPKKVSEGQNAAPLYDKAFTKYDLLVAVNPKLDEVLKASGDFKQADVQAVAPMLNDAGPMFALIDQAIAKPHYWADHDWTSSSFEFPEAGGLKKLAKILRLKADSETYEGNFEASAHDLAKMLKIAAHTGEETILITELVQDSIEQMFRRGAYKLLTAANGSAKSIDLVEQAIKSYGPLPSFKRAMLCELAHSPASVDTLDETTFEQLKPLGVDESQYKQLIAKDMDRKTRNAAYKAVSYSFARKEAPLFRNDHLSDLQAVNEYSKLLKDEEKLGGPHIYNYLDGGTEVSVGGSLVFVGASRDMLKLCLRILTFHNQVGQYPKSLEALPGDHHLDPFNGKPFAYEVTDGGFKISCSGPDSMQEVARTFVYRAPAN